MSNLNESSVYRTAIAGYIMPVGRPLVGGSPWCPTFVKVRYSKWMISSDPKTKRAAHDLNAGRGFSGLTSDEHWPDGFHPGDRSHSTLGVSPGV